MHLLPFVPLMYCLSHTHHFKSFTAFNAIALAITCSMYVSGITNLRAYCYQILPVFALTTCAMTLTFIIFGNLVDNTFYERMIQKNEWTHLQFSLGDLCYHTIPSCVLFISVIRYSSDWSDIFIRNPFFVQEAILVNMVWGAINGNGSFDLSGVYVHCSPEVWAVAWSINTVLYCGIGNVILYIVRTQ